MINNNLEELARKLGLHIKNRQLFARALTHSSAAQESREASNERLEFLGDAVLGLIISEYLHLKFPEWSEGELTRAKAALVSEPTLAEAAREMDLGAALQLSKGEELSGGADRSSILCGAFEALIAAIYKDEGLNKAREFILDWLAEQLKAVDRGEFGKDHKTLLQEQLQNEHRTLPQYRVIQETGPDHDKTFVVEVCLDDEVLGVGSGKSKKDAERAAAKDALEKGENCRR